jgi:trigger factor
MQVRIEEVSPISKKLIVQVPWETVSSKLGEAYRDLGRNVSLKGFRKGKVPRSVLERMFGKKVREEVAGQLVRESFITAATEHELDAVSEPHLEHELEIQRGQPLEFEAVVEVKGKPEVGEYEGFELEKRKLQVADEAVDKALAQLRDEHTELMPIEGRDVSASTDVIAIKLSGAIGDQEIDRPQLVVDLGDHEREPLPGLAKALTGLPLSVEDHPVELEMPSDFADESVAGKSAKLTVSILDARKKEVPELDDEFAKDTGKAETLDELRGVLRAEIEKRESRMIENELQEAALKELVKRNQIPVAEALIERAIDSKLQRFQQMLGMQAGQMPGFGEEMRKDLRDGAADDVRGQLLLEALAEKESLEVADEDIDARIAEIAAEQNSQPARLRAEMDRDGRLESLRFQLRQEKALELVVSRAVVQEVEKLSEPEENPEASSNEEGEGGSDPEASKPEESGSAE